MSGVFSNPIFGIKIHRGKKSYSEKQLLNEKKCNEPNLEEPINKKRKYCERVMDYGERCDQEVCVNDKGIQEPYCIVCYGMKHAGMW